MGLLDLLTDFGRTQQQGVGLRPGTAGFNPDAPDPRGVGLEAPPQGGFLGPPPASSPPPRATEPDPRDLSQLPTLQKIGLLLSATSAGMRGQRSPIDELIEQRQRQAELRTAQRRQAFVQNLELLDKFRGFLDTVPISERPARAAQLRQRYEQEFGGPSSGEFFDAVLGDPDNAAGITGQLADDPEIQAVLADPRATMADVRRVRETPEFLQRAAERQDAALLPVVKGKLQKLLGAQNPTMRDAIARMQKDGVITPVEVRELNALAGEGPEGFRLTSGELATLDRQQGALAAEIPGFQPNEESQAKRKTQLDLEKTRQEEAIQTAGQIAVERERARLRRMEPGEAPTPTAGLNFAARVDAVRRVYFDSEANLANAIAAPLNGVGDLTALYSLIKNQDDTAAREGELALAQRTASVLGRIQRLAGNVTDGRLLDEKVRGQIREALQSLQGDTRKLHRDYVSRTKKTAETFGVPVQGVLPDLESFIGGAEAPAARRTARTPDGRTIEVEQGPDGRWKPVQ